MVFSCVVLFLNFRSTVDVGSLATVCLVFAKAQLYRREPVYYSYGSVENKHLEYEYLYMRNREAAAYDSRSFKIPLQELENRRKF